MRAVVGALLMMLLSACASDKLALLPPPGVDMTGHWKLNEADSDDPLRLVQSQNATNSPSAQGGQGGQGGGQGGQGGGRGGRQGGRGGPGAGLPGTPMGPAMPGIGAIGAGLRWPGKTLEVKQVAGVVTFDSDGKSQVFRPVAGDRKARPHHGPPGDDPSHGRDLPAHGRGDGPPPRCGWEERTLVVQGDDPDDDHPPFEERYSLSEDGQRLIEVVGFKGGRSAGFTLSRVWDRVGLNGPGPDGRGLNGQGPD
jgi:hypothetical protein